MTIEEITNKTKDGRELTIRNAEPADAKDLIWYLKKTAEETSYLVRESEEITITEEQETNFINSLKESERSIMLLAFVDGKHAGNCSLSEMPPRKRYNHRCSIAIALLQEYWGLGIGKKLFEEAIRFAKDRGYEQIELEVHTGNEKAIALYKSFGFEIYGTLKNDMKYKDGSYSDCHLMVKYL